MSAAELISLTDELAVSDYGHATANVRRPYFDHDLCLLPVLWGVFRPDSQPLSPHGE